MIKGLKSLEFTISSRFGEEQFYDESHTRLTEDQAGVLFSVPVIVHRYSLCFIHYKLF